MKNLLNYGIIKIYLCCATIRCTYRNGFDTLFDQNYISQKILDYEENLHMNPTNSYEEKYDYSVSFVRFVATFMIVWCHILQHYGRWDAFWFNCGVQIFIFISGFLFGQRKIEDGYKFIKKRLYRILLDYYICLIFDLIIYYFVNREGLTWDGIKGLLFFNRTIRGLGHLWFIPTICFLYIATPLFVRILDDLEEFLDSRVTSRVIAKIIEYVVLWFLFVWIGKFIGVLSYVNCLIYCLGLLAGRNKVKNPQKNTWLKVGCRVAAPLAIIGTGLCISYEQLGKIAFFSTHTDFYSRWFYPLNHAALGIGIFCVLYFLEDKIGIFRRFSKIAKLSDKYSYDIYLSHHIWVQNPVSLFNLPFAFIPKFFLTALVVGIQTVLVRLLSDKTDKNIVKSLTSKGAHNSRTH